LGLIVNEAVDLQGVMLDPDPSLLVAELSAQARELVRDVVLLAGQPIALINTENLFTVLQRPEWHQTPADAATDRWRALSAIDQALLRARAVELAEAEHTDSDQEGQPWIVVEIGGERFGIDAAAVRELAELPVIVPLPCCPSHVLGNANLRGEIVTAIDISPWLGQERRPAVTRSLVAIVQVEDLTVGLVIDRAIETQWVSAQRLAPVPFNTSTAEQLAPANGSLDSTIANRDSAYIRGIHVHGGQATSWLDVATLLRDPSLVVNESL
jgi:purine-binding chemotaxis protein CheW